MFDTTAYDTFANVKSKCYIAKFDKTETDDYGNKIPTYLEPNTEPYLWNIQKVSQSSENAVFGEKVIRMKVAVITGTERDEILNEFKEYDLAYLDGATPEGETVYGQNANYRIYSIANQNVSMKIYFEKII